MPRMTHPDLPADQVIEAVDSRVPVLEKSGWVVVDEPRDPDPLSSPEPSIPPASTPAPNPAPDHADPASAGSLKE